MNATSKSTTSRSIADKNTPETTYRIMVVTDSGCEEACTQEIALYLPKLATELTQQRNTHHIVEFNATIAQAAMLGYHLQTARHVLVRVLPTLDSLNTISDDSAQFPSALINNIFPQACSFKVEAQTLEQHPLWNRKTRPNVQKKLPMTQELIEEIGAWSYEHLVTRAPDHHRRVDLKRPDIIVRAISSPAGIDIGIDVVGTPLAKREYRIMMHTQRGVKSTIAAAMILYAGATKGTILDPMPGDGMLVIEAALMRTRTSPRKFQHTFSCAKFPALQHDPAGAQTWRKEHEKTIDRNNRDIMAFASTMKEMKAVRTNSKLAACDDAILSTRVAVDWMDVKLDEKSVDCIVTAPPASGKSLLLKDAAKLHDLLFNQAAYVLKKKGTITCLTEKPEELELAAAQHHLSVTTRRTVLMGLREMSIVTFAQQ